MARYRAVKKFFPVIVLYDQIFANTPVTLKNLIDAELRANGINSFEYQIWHIEELEVLLKAIPKDKICGVIEQSSLTPPSKQWTFRVFSQRNMG